MTGRETFWSADGLTLTYRTVGEGPLLVCQPGGPGRASSYLRDLGGLARTRTLLLLDSRGTGSSGHPDDPTRLASPYLAEDLAALRAHLGLATFDLLGHSAGAVVAQRYAAAHPETLRRLVLVTPSGRLQGRAGADIPDIVARRRAEEPHLAEAVEAFEQEDYGAASRPLLYGRWDDEIATHAAGADVEMDAVAEEHFTPPSGTADDAAVVAALAAVTAPVLVVAGDRDAATGVDGARAVAESFPAARLEVLPECGHFPWVEQPAEFAGLVEAFLAE